MKQVEAKAMFTLSIYEILLSKVRSVLWPTQQSTGSKSLKVSAKKQKYIANLFHLLEKWLIYKIRRFWIIFKFFGFCLSRLVPQKLKNSIIEMPIITQTLNINNLRNTSTKSINLILLKNLLNVLWEMLQQRQFLVWPFSRYCCPKVRRYCDQPSGAQQGKGFKFQ